MDELERIVSDNVRTIGDSSRISGLVKALRACKVKFTAGQLARFIENGGIRRIEAVDMCPNAASLARHLNMKDAQEAQSYIDGMKRDGIICGFGNRAFVSLPKEDWTRLSR